MKLKRRIILLAWGSIVSTSISYSQKIECADISINADSVIYQYVFENSESPFGLEGNFEESWFNARNKVNHDIIFQNFKLKKYKYICFTSMIFYYQNGQQKQIGFTKHRKVVFENSICIKLKRREYKKMIERLKSNQ